MTPPPEQMSGCCSYHVTRRRLLSHPAPPHHALELWRQPPSAKDHLEGKTGISTCVISRGLRPDSQQTVLMDLNTMLPRLRKSKPARS